jgi:alkylhydroperoxidase family enzyme
MARISFTDGPAEASALTDRIRAERRGSLLNIYKLLLHSPGLTETWLDHFNAVRWRTTLPGRLREIVVIRIAHLHDMAYVLRQHVPKLAVAEGLSVPECDALEDWHTATTFDPNERAALAYADAMVQQGKVPEGTFETLRAHFDERAIVELTVLIGSYIMHNRVFGALDVDLEPSS